MNRMHRTAFAIALGIAPWLLAEPALAQNPQQNPVRVAAQPPAQEAAKPVAPGDVNLDKSRVYVRVGKTGFGHDHGVTGKLKQGKIHLADPQAGDSLVFDMATFDADSPGARKYVGLTGTTDEATRSQVNANLLGPSVLNARQFPTATFQVKSITKLASSNPAEQSYRIDGDFTLHGTTRRISVQSRAEDSGDWTHLRGSFAILQSDFGITPFSKAFGAVGVADRLEIWGDFWVANPR